MKKKRAGIKITTVFIEETGEENRIVLQTDGEWMKGEGKSYFFYEEQGENKEEPVRNRLIISEKHMELKKSGAVSWEAFFREGIRHEALYHTIHGTIPMAVITERFSHHMESSMLRLEIDYHLEIQGKLQNKCTMKIILSEI